MATPTIPNGETQFFPIIYEGSGGGKRVGRFVAFDDASGGTIANSVIFNSPDDPKLGKTFTGAGTNTTWTFSCWIKLGIDTSNGRRMIFSAGTAGSNYGGAELSSTGNNTLEFYNYVSGSYAWRLQTNRTLEDRSKFYHLLFVSDTTNSTEADRARIYIDGDRVTSFAIASYPSLNYASNFWMGTTEHEIGTSIFTTMNFDGYMAEVNQVDGQSLLPASFGLTDTSTGRWIPAQVKPHPTTTTTYLVTVVGGNPSNHPYYNVGSTNKFAINGSTATADVDLTLYEGATYRFDQSDSSNSGHPLRFSTVAHGTNASGGTEYTTNVTVVGTPGTSGAYTEITVASSAPDLHFYCSNHNGMGYQGSTPNGYGTNGFRLTFSDSSNFGTDTSGNSNTFTATNLATTDQTTDSPTQNHATIDSNSASNTSMTFAEGNLKVSMNNAYPGNVLGTLGASSGKYYWEVTISGTGSSANGYATGIGVEEWSGLNSDAGGVSTPFSTFIDSRGYFIHNGGSVSNSTTFTAGDVIGVALNLDDSEISFYKNNTIVGTAQPIIENQTYFPLFKNSTGVANLEYSPNFGQKSWNYSAPTGFVALQQDNLPETAKGVSGLVWTKNRDSTDSHQLYDSSRGKQKDLHSNTTDAEGTTTDGLQKFLAGGQQIEDNDAINTAGESFVSWNWVANSGTTSTNTDGSITSTVQANTTAGFSIVQYTGTGSNATVGHGLSKKIDWMIIKELGNSNGWIVSHKGLTSQATYSLNLSNANAEYSDAGTYYWNSTAPTSSVFSIATDTAVNRSSGTYVAYCWNSVDGFSRFSKYVGNGSASDGPFIYTGFKPRWVMFKTTDGEGWYIYDTTRNTYNGLGFLLRPDVTNADYNYGLAEGIISLSNGFKVYGNSGWHNTSGQDYIYMAFAEHPFIGDGVSPATAR